MAISTCVKCGGKSFEAKENSPKDSVYRLIFIQCSSCGGVVGTTEYYNIGSILEKLFKALKVPW